MGTHELVIHIEQNNEKAREKATAANKAYWEAIQGTLDPIKITRAVDNALVGHPETIAKQVKERFHDDDRLMLWFDFNNHDNKDVCQSMEAFMEKVRPMVKEL